MHRVGRERESLQYLSRRSSFGKVSLDRKGECCSPIGIERLAGTLSGQSIVESCRRAAGLGSHLPHAILTARHVWYIEIARPLVGLEIIYFKIMPSQLHVLECLVNTSVNDLTIHHSRVLDALDEEVGSARHVGEGFQGSRRMIGSESDKHMRHRKMVVEGLESLNVFGAAGNISVGHKHIDALDSLTCNVWKRS